MYCSRTYKPFQYKRGHWKLQGEGVGVASKAKFVRENIYARISSGVGKVSIGTVWSVSSSFIDTFENTVF